MKNTYTRRPPLQPKSTAMPVWVWVACAFFGGYVIAVCFDWTSMKATYQALWTPPPQKKESKAPTVAVKPQFEFYTLLTQKEPEVSQEEPTQTVTEQKIVLPHEPPKAEQFMVQLAAFNNQIEAERMRASLALKGVITRVIASSQDAHQWYRVIAGPFANKEEAIAAQNTIIKKEGIRGIIRKA